MFLVFFKWKSVSIFLLSKCLVLLQNLKHTAELIRCNLLAEQNVVQFKGAAILFFKKIANGAQSSFLSRKIAL